MKRNNSARGRTIRLVFSLTLIAMLLVLPACKSKTGKSRGGPNQFIVVQFEGTGERDVFIDGKKAGTTNSILRLNPGTFTITLGGEKDFEPSVQQIEVERTSIVKPKEIRFVPN